MNLTKEQVLERLRQVRGPGLKDNIVDLGLVSEILLKEGRVSFSITVPPDKARELDPMRQAAEKVVRDLPGVTSVLAVLTAERSGGPGARGAGHTPESARVQQARARSGAGASPPSPTQAHPAPAGPARRQAITVAGIRHMIAVASGKGGVGKSTTAVNLALALQAIGLKAGILDADIYGPSQPRLLGLSGRPQTAGSNRLRPMEAYGLQAMSMGFLVDEGTPII